MHRAVLGALVGAAAAASHNPASGEFLDSSSTTTLPLENDKLSFRVDMYPAKSGYSRGQYLRLRLSVSAEDHNNLITQDPRYQWVNASADEAGLMLIKHYVNGAEASGVNLCNATSGSDVLAFSTDLSSASGGSGMFLWGEATDVVCQHTTPNPTPVPVGAPSPDPDAALVTSSLCETEPDAQMLDAYATFELPGGFDGQFRVCFRQSRSRAPGSDGNETNKYYRWREPVNLNASATFNLTSTPPVYYSVAGGDIAVGDHAVVQVHPDVRSNEPGVRLAGSSSQAESDQVKFVPAGSPCIEETPTSVYPGTALVGSTGQWGEEAGMTDYYMAGVAPGHAAMALGVSEVALGATIESHPHISSTDYLRSEDIVTAEALNYSTLAFVAPTVTGTYDVCYSERTSRTSTVAWVGDIIDPRVQGPSGWRKLSRKDADAAGSRITVVTVADTVSWSAADNDTQAATWGSIRVSRSDGALATSAATVHDEDHVVPRFTSLEGGDMVRLVANSSFAEGWGGGLAQSVGCWTPSVSQKAEAPSGLPYSADLLAGPSYLQAWTSGPLAPDNTNATDPEGHVYMRYPDPGRYWVCYRPAGGWWRRLAMPLDVDTYAAALETWNLGTSGNAQASTEGVFSIGVDENGTAELTTMPWDPANPYTGVALLAPPSVGCQPSHQELVAAATTPLALDMDLGVEFYGVGGAGGHLESTYWQRQVVSAVLTLPDPAASPYLVCLKKGSGNWRALAFQADRGDPTVTIDSTTLGSLSPANAPAVSFTFDDRRRDTYARVLVSATGSDDPLGLQDRLKLVPPGQRCQDGGGAHYEVDTAYPYCQSPSTNASHVCYSAQLEDNLRYSPAALYTDLSDVVWFMHVPSTMWASGAGESDTPARLCYLAAGKNWLPLSDNITLTAAHGINVTLHTLLPGGTNWAVPVSAAGAETLWFDLGLDRDEVKVVLASQTCAYPALQRARTGDLLAGVGDVNNTDDDSASATLATAVIPLPVVSGDTAVALCFRQHRVTSSSETYYNWARFAEGTVVRSLGVKYSLSTSFVQRGVANFRFLARDSNLHGGDGHDAFKLIRDDQYCVASSHHMGEDRYYGTAAPVTAGVPVQTRGCSEDCVLGEKSVNVPEDDAVNDGTFRVCYYLAAAGLWAEVEEESDVNRVVELGAAVGVASADAAHVLTAVDVAGVFNPTLALGADLFAPDAELGGDPALLGGIATTLSRTATPLLFHLRVALAEDIAALKLVRAYAWEADLDQTMRFVPTYAACDAPGVETEQILALGDVSSPTGVSPVFDMPTSPGRYLVCVRWTGVPGATWVKHPIIGLSETEPYDVPPTVLDTVTVATSGLTYTLTPGGADLPALVVHDVHPNGASLAAGGEEQSSDWVRVIPANESCRDVENVRSLGGTTGVEAYIYPLQQDGAYLETITTPLAGWPPLVLNGPAKVCYRKLLSDTKAGTARVPCCQWVVVPQEGTGAATLTPFPPRRIEWLAPATASNTTVVVGDLLTVSVRVVDELGAAMPGRYWIGFEEAGAAMLPQCVEPPHTHCSGAGWMDAGSQCDTPQRAYEHGWPANNTIVQTDDSGVATALLTWRRPCEGCALRATWFAEVTSGGAIEVQASDLFTFDAISRDGVYLHIPARNLDGYLADAAPAASWKLTDETTRRFAVHTASADGLPAVTTGGMQANVTFSADHLAYVEIWYHTGEPHAPDVQRVVAYPDHSGVVSVIRFSLSVAMDGVMDLEVTVHPKWCSKATSAWCPSTLEVDVRVEVEGASAVEMRIHTTTAVPAILEPVGMISDENLAALPATWMAAEWPAFLRHAGRRTDAAQHSQSLHAVRAAPGHYLMRGEKYTLLIDLRDAAGNKVPRSVLETAPIDNARVGLWSAAGGDLSKYVTGRRYGYFQPKYGGHEGVFMVSFRVNTHCSVAEPCTVRVHFEDWYADVVTPIRTVATHLVYAGRPPTLNTTNTEIQSITPDDSLGPFELRAVGDDGTPDEFHNAWVWPLLNSGDGVVNRQGLSIRSPENHVGRAAAVEMLGGAVTFTGLRLNGPTPLAADTRVHFLSSSGLRLFETAALEVRDTSDIAHGTLTVRNRQIEGNADTQPPDLEPITVAMHEWFTIRYIVLDTSRQDTTYVNVSLTLNSTYGHPATVDGGTAALKVVNSVAELRLKFGAMCTDCAITLGPATRVRGWWTSRGSAVYTSPPISVTNVSAPSRVELKEELYVKQSNGYRGAGLVHVDGGRGPAAEDVNPEGISWYQVDQNVEFVVRFRVVNAEGLLPDAFHPLAEGLVFLQVEPIGDQVLDGNGGSFRTDPLVARMTGVQLRSGEGVVSLLFDRPCLQCKLKLYTSETAVAPLHILLTVLPKATRVAVGEGPSFASSSRLTYAPVTGDRNTSQETVWQNVSFTYADIDAIDYTRGVAVAVSVAGARQTLICAAGCHAPRGEAAVGSVPGNTIVEQARRRKAGEMTPYVEMLLAGAEPDVVGTLNATALSLTFNATTADGEPLAPWGSEAYLAWTGSSTAAKLVVMQETDFFPAWAGYPMLDGTTGYLTEADHPAQPLSYDQVAGVAFPVTVEVQDAVGNRAVNMSGRASAILVAAQGCGSGMPLTEYGGGMVGGNATLWLTFGSPCEACSVEITITPCPTCPSLSRADSTVQLGPFRIVPKGPKDFTHIVVDEAASRIPTTVEVGEAITLTLKAMAHQNGRTYTVREAAPSVVVYNALISDEKGYGTARSDRGAVGLGGLLRPSTFLWQSPDHPASHRGVKAHFTDGVAVVSVMYGRTCEACAIEVFVGDAHVNTSFVVYTNVQGRKQDGVPFGSVGSEMIRVTTKGTRKVLRRGDPPALMREQHFTLTQLIVNEVGDLDDAPNGLWNLSAISRTNAGGNGNGGRLTHTNDALTLREGRANWYHGALVWRLRFSSSCETCAVQIDDYNIMIPVYTAAAGLRVAHLAPADGVVPRNVSMLDVTLYAEDAEGNRDYLLNGAGRLNLSSSATAMQAFYPAQSGDGGAIVFTQAKTGGLDHFAIANGEASVTVAFGDPAFLGYLWFYLVDDEAISSKEDALVSMPAPPRVTVYVPPHSLQVLQVATAGMAFAGNPAVIVVGLADSGGWVAGLASGYVDMRMKSCDAGNVTYPDGVQATLIGGVASFGVVMTNVPPATSKSVEVWEEECVNVTSFDTGGTTEKIVTENCTNTTYMSSVEVLPECTFEFEVFSEALADVDDALRVTAATVQIATPRAVVVGFDTPTLYPPTHGVAGVPLKLPLAVYALGGMRVPSHAGDWVALSTIECDFVNADATNSSTTAYIDGEGRASIDVVVSGTGLCLFELQTASLGAWNRTGHDGDPFAVTGIGNKTFGVTFQQPAAIEVIRASVGGEVSTPTYPFVDLSTASTDLATTTPYPFMVRVLDANGDVVRGDHTTVLTLELTDGPDTLQVRNRNAAAATATVAPAFARRTPAVVVAAGVYVFSLEFDAPTDGNSAAFRVTAEFAADGMDTTNATSPPLDLVVTAQAIVIDPAPPAHWLVNESLALSVHLTDLVGNRAPDMAEEQGDAVVEGRIIEMVPVGFGGNAFFTFLAPAGGTIKTTAPAVNYTVVWDAAPGKVEYELACRRLQSYVGAIVFQDIAGLQLSSGRSGAQEFARTDRLSLGITVVDSAGARVVGDDATVVTAAVRDGSPSIIVATTALSETVVDGIARIGFRFESGGEGNYITVTAATAHGAVHTVEYGPFTVLADDGSGPPPPTLVRYTPPKASVATSTPWSAFNPVDFAIIMAEALTLKQDNIRPLWGCPWVEGEPVPAPGATQGCTELASVQTVLVGSNTAPRRGQDMLAVKAGARGAGVQEWEAHDSWVEFQVVLSAAQGLQGSLDAADAATKSVLDDLEDVVANPTTPRLAQLIGEYTNQTLGRTDVQTPEPTLPTLPPPPPRPTTTPRTAIPATSSPWSNATFQPYSYSAAGNTAPSVLVAVAAAVALWAA